MRILWLWATVGLLLLVGCARGAPTARPIDLESTVNLAGLQGTADQQVLRVAVSAMISPKETLVSYHELLEYIGARVGRPIRLVQRPTYAEVNDLVREGEVDFAFVCTWAYVDGTDQFGMELLAAPQVNGEAVYYSYLIVPSHSTAQSLDDLKGGTFAFTDPLSNTGRLIPVYWLWEMGQTPEQFFNKQIFTYSHDRAVRAVADGLVHGAAVDHLVYLAMLKQDPTLEKRIRVIRISEPVGTPPAVVGPQVDPVTREQIRQVLLTMHGDPEGAAILRGLHIERWVPLPESAYHPIRRMLQVVGRPEQ